MWNTCKWWTAVINHRMSSSNFQFVQMKVSILVSEFFDWLPRDVVLKFGSVSFHCRIFSTYSQWNWKPRFSNKGFTQCIIILSHMRGTSQSKSKAMTKNTVISTKRFAILKTLEVCCCWWMHTSLFTTSFGVCLLIEEWKDWQMTRLYNKRAWVFAFNGPEIHTPKLVWMTELSM